MSKIVLLSYNGGSCGEFLTLQISKDENYYPLTVEHITDENRWILVSPLEKYKINLKTPWLRGNTGSVSNEISDRIDQEMSEKHLLIPTHIYESENRTNLRRLHRIRLQSRDWNLFFFTLLWIKNYTKPIPLINNIIDDDLLFSLKVSKNKELANVMLARIKARGLYYGFERPATRHGMINLNDIIGKEFLDQLKVNCMTVPGWTPLTVDYLLLNPKDHVEEWRSAFDMKQCMDINAIEEYHATNVKLFEDNLNMTYREYQKNWKILLAEWVKTKTDYI
jgi:hypothetical protein